MKNLEPGCLITDLSPVKRWAKKQNPVKDLKGFLIPLSRIVADILALSLFDVSTNILMLYYPNLNTFLQTSQYG